MGKTKMKLQQGQCALGSWVMIGHPTAVELLAGEGLDWIAVDTEHTSIDIRSFGELVLAAKGTDCDILVRLHSCDPVQAKQVLDAGADGIIVPMVNSAAEAELAVKMAKYPPEGFRGTAFSRASDFGRNFQDYFHTHNEKVLVVVMLEHIQAVERIDEILAVEGIDATFIGPCDLSASMGKAGQLDDPQVARAQQKLLQACQAHNIAAGIHVVAVDGKAVKSRIAEGFRFIACWIDTQFIIYGCRGMLREAKGDA